MHAKLTTKLKIKPTNRSVQPIGKKKKNVKRTRKRFLKGLAKKLRGEGTQLKRTLKAPCPRLIEADGLDGPPLELPETVLLRPGGPN